MAIDTGVMGWPAWGWIPLVIAASMCHTVRNAAQWSLSPKIGGTSATLVRFFFGLPFSLAWLGALLAFDRYAVPSPSWKFVGHVFGGAALQVIATAMLLAAMSRRGFGVSVVFSKSEVIQIAVLSMLFLGETPSGGVLASVVLATLGVAMLASPKGLPSARELFGPLAAATALGIGAGAAFGASNIFFRAAALTLGDTPPMLIGALATVVAQISQTALIGGYLLWRHPLVIRRMFGEWRLSLLAGATSTTATALGFMALSLKPATEVRALGLVEVVFSYVVSRAHFKERIGPREIAGAVLLGSGVLVLLRVA